MHKELYQNSDAASFYSTQYQYLYFSVNTPL